MLVFFCVSVTIFSKGVISLERVYMPTEQSFKLSYSPWGEMTSFKKEVPISNALNILLKRQ